MFKITAGEVESHPYLKLYKVHNHSSLVPLVNLASRVSLVKYSLALEVEWL